MALQKSLVNNQGHTGDYWDIVSIHMDILGDWMDVRLSLFKDEAAFTAGSDSMESRNLTISPLPASMNGILTSIFAQIKTQVTSDQEEGDTPFFDGATDV